VTRIVEVIDACLAGNGPSRQLTMDPGFEGLPDTAHGGSILGVFDRLWDAGGAREVLGTYRRRVPSGVPLTLEVVRAGDSEMFALRDGRGTLVDGHVLPAVADEADAAGVGDVGHRVPVSTTCFACGIDNPIGLRLQLQQDDSSVWGQLVPGEPFRAADGSVATVALTTALDETAFWLGALATGESGMTTEVRVRLHRPARFGELLVISGSRHRVGPLPTDPRYLVTEPTVHDASGRLIASGRIIFVTVRGAARRLVAGLLAMNPPETLRRVFPAYMKPNR
jgi:acyl-coenzyme A thioesterase PaaI-like protein